MTRAQTTRQGSGLLDPDSFWARRGWVFAAIWLIYLGYPVAAALRDAAILEKLAALAALAVFGAIFVVAIVRARSRRRAGLPPRYGELAAALLAMSALLVVAEPAAGQDVLGASIYIAMLAVMGLPTRWGWSVVAVLVAAIETLSRVVPTWTSDETFTLQLVLAALAGWGVQQLLTRNIELALAREQISELAVVAERERVGRDMHDILGHSLTVIAIKAELAGRLLDVDQGKTRAEIADMESLARQALADVRGAVVGLRSVTLAAELANARTALTAAGIAATVPTAVDVVPDGRRELFAWAVREGVTNVIRHSGASSCRVALSATEVVVDDDGCGFREPADAGASSGLRGLRGRVDSAGGALLLGAGPDGGFRLRVSVR